jgi:hypothetical protein
MENAPRINSIEGSVSFTVGLEAVEKRNVLSLPGIENPAVQPVVHRCTYSAHSIILNPIIYFTYLKHSLSRENSAIS